MSSWVRNARCAQQYDDHEDGNSPGWLSCNRVRVTNEITESPPENAGFSDCRRAPVSPANETEKSCSTSFLTPEGVMRLITES